MLLHIPGVLDREQVARFRSALEGAEWIDGRQTVGAQGAQVKRNQQLGEADPLRRELGDIVLAALARNPLRAKLPREHTLRQNVQVLELLEEVVVETESHGTWGSGPWAIGLRP